MRTTTTRQRALNPTIGSAKQISSKSHWLKPLAILCCLVNAVSGGTFGLFTYTDDGTNITITDYPESAVGAVEIPAKIPADTGKPVTSIGYFAFDGCINLTSVTIPSSITNIEQGAFNRCTSLTGLTIPASVASINALAFSGCSNLSLISIDAVNPNYSSDGGVLFDKAKKLLIQCPGGKAGSYTIPAGVTSIGAYAFMECSKLTSVTLPIGLTEVSNATFYNCTGLTNVTIPDSVTGIGAYAFRSCISLLTVTIPASVISIGDSAFSDCNGLTSITIDAVNPNYSSDGGVLFDKAKKLLIQCPGGKAGSYTIPAGVISIGRGSFGRCSKLTSVTIPSGVTSIGEYAFSKCSSLTSVTIPSGATSIGEGAFDRCSSLASVTIPSSVIVIGKQAFGSCASLTSVTLPIGLTEVSNATFYNCTGLTNVTIPDSVTGIGTSAFTGCSSLTTVTIPTNVTSIGDIAFMDCSSLTTVTIPASVTSIGDSAFSGCNGLTTISVAAANPNYSSEDGVLFDKAKTLLMRYPSAKVGGYTIPASVTDLGNCAFTQCVGLTSITIPCSVTSIGGGMFYDCRGLSTVTIPDSVTIIGSGAFMDCQGLVSVVIGTGVTSIEDAAFYSCGELNAAVFRGNAPLLGGNVFSPPPRPDFAVYYLSGAKDFTTPTWQGYRAFPGAPPQFTSAAPPATGKVGTAYNHACTASGTPVPTFAVTSGALPDGMSISSAGIISGAPTVAGIFTGTVAASNGFPSAATQAFTIDTNEYRTLTTGGTHGTVTGGGIYLLNATATLTATRNPGFLFASWTGDATGNTNQLSVLMNSDKTITASFTPDANDTDGDGLTNYQEIVEYGTDPANKDTDEDGVKDGVDALPLDPTETLDSDNDGIGDNADLDDDGDGYSDADEVAIYHTDPKRGDSDGDGLSDPQELQTYHTDPNLADSDNDGLNDGAEISHHTNPKAPDTDGDGFLDGYEVLTGKLPLDIADHPALVAEARTAIEFTFPAALGKTYRIEDSLDLDTWTIVESGIAGNGEQVQRFYSTRGMPMRYFRVEEVAP